MARICFLLSLSVKTKYTKWPWIQLQYDRVLVGGLSGVRACYVCLLGRATNGNTLYLWTRRHLTTFPKLLTSNEGRILRRSKTLRYLLVVITRIRHNLICTTCADYDILCKNKSFFVAAWQRLKTTTARPPSLTVNPIRQRRT